MMKREDLETLDWTYLDAEQSIEEEGVPAIFDSSLGYALALVTPRGEEMPCGDLMAEAPKLALACLEALELTRRVAEHFVDTDAPLGIAAQDVRSLLFNELTAAGVEAG